MADSQERSGLFGVTGCHPPPLFEIQEGVFHQMPQFIQVPVIIPGVLAVASGRNHRVHTPSAEAATAIHR